MFTRRIATAIARPLLRTPLRKIKVTSSTLLSKGDSELVNYVNEQLEFEKPRAIPRISGWSECGEFNLNPVINILNTHLKNFDLRTRFQFSRPIVLEYLPRNTKNDFLPSLLKA